MARSALLNVMVQAAIKAGRGLSRDFGEVQNLQVSLKGPGDYVSQADRKAEEVIFAELSKARPGYGFLMEERGAVEGEDDQHRWIVDPLDGTTNFLHGIPIFSVSRSRWSGRARSSPASCTIPRWTSSTPPSAAAAHS
jgi:myo-inositol-1(or 4)-monophosphatase